VFEAAKFKLFTERSSLSKAIFTLTSFDSILSNFSQTKLDLSPAFFLSPILQQSTMLTTTQNTAFIPTNKIITKTGLISSKLKSLKLKKPPKQGRNSLHTMHTLHTIQRRKCRQNR